MHYLVSQTLCPQAKTHPERPRNILLTLPMPNTPLHHFCCPQPSICFSSTFCIAPGSICSHQGQWIFSSLLPLPHPRPRGPGTVAAKNLPAMWEAQVRSLGWEDLLEKEMATHSSILAWRIPWTEEPDGLGPTGSQRVRHRGFACVHDQLPGREESG